MGTHFRFGPGTTCGVDSQRKLHEGVPAIPEGVVFTCLNPREWLGDPCHCRDSQAEQVLPFQIGWEKLQHFRFFPYTGHGLQNFIPNTYIWTKRHFLIPNLLLGKEEKGSHIKTKAKWRPTAHKDLPDPSKAHGQVITCLSDGSSFLLKTFYKVLGERICYGQRIKQSWKVKSNITEIHAGHAAYQIFKGLIHLSNTCR